MELIQYKCPKCSGVEYSKDEMRATGGFWTKLFNIQNRKFTTISCKNCGYTEFYNRSTRGAENVLDFFTN